MQHAELVALRKRLVERFSIGELRTLCFDMGIDHENLPGTKDELVRELVAGCARKGRADELAQLVEQELSGGIPLRVAPPSLHQLPPPPADFVGREEELAELTAAIAEGGVTITGVRGMGGIGKTALALVLAERLTPDYPDAQFYLDLQGTSQTPLTAAQAMAHVVRQFHPTASLPEDAEQLTALYRSVLHGKRALLLMDNAADREQVEPLACPTSCVLLVTSRRRFTVPGLKTVDLDALPLADAEALLLKIAPRIGEHATALADACGCLPLALRVTGSLLSERIDLRPAEHLLRLEDEKARLGLVEASLSLSYDLLPEDLQRRWRCLGVFPGTFDWMAAAAVWGVPVDEEHEGELEGTREDLGELVRYSLVEWDEESARYRLHDLARVFAGSLLGAEERAEAERRHAARYVGVLAAADDWYFQGGEDLVLQGLALFDAERHNIEAGQEWAAAHAEEDEGAAALCSRYPHAGVYCLALRLHSAEWIRWLDAAVAACQASGDRRDEGNHLGNLGIAYRDLGEVGKAVDCYERALAIAQEILEASTEGTPEWTVARRGEGVGVGNLGLAYSDLGEMGTAIDYLERALAIAQEIGDRRREGNHLGNLANAYSDLGEVGKAIDYYERALAIAQEIGDRSGEGTWLGNLANAYRDLGEVGKAIDYHERALAIAQEIGDRRGEGVSVGNLGLAYHDLGEMGKAIDCTERALAIAQEIGDRRVEGMHSWNLGLLYEETNPERAVALMSVCLAYEKEIGHPDAGKDAARIERIRARIERGQRKRWWQFWR